MIRAGIDNGLDGAIVAVDHTGQAVLQEVMPVLGGKKRHLDMVGLLQILNDLKWLGGVHLKAGIDLYVVLEVAQVMPAQGAVSGFTIGRGFGAIEMALLALGIPHEVRRPKQWQQSVGVRVAANVPKDKRRSETKRQVIQIVRRRLPSLDLTPGRKRVPHDGLSDAGGMALDAIDLRPFTVVKRSRRKPPRKG